MTQGEESGDGATNSVTDAVRLDQSAITNVESNLKNGDPLNAALADKILELRNNLDAYNAEHEDVEIDFINGTVNGKPFTDLGSGPG